MGDEPKARVKYDSKNGQITFGGLEPELVKHIERRFKRRKYLSLQLSVDGVIFSDGGGNHLKLADDEADFGQIYR
jgi:hypothetical protein